MADRGLGYGSFHPRTRPQRIRFSFSVGAASGTFQRILPDAIAALRAAPCRDVTGGLFSDNDCDGTTQSYGVKSGSSWKDGRMSFAIRSNRESVGSPRINSIVLRMLWWE